MLESRPVNIHPGKITAWISLAGTIAALSFWVFGANASHVQTGENRSAIEILTHVPFFSVVTTILLPSESSSASSALTTRFMKS